MKSKTPRALSGFLIMFLMLISTAFAYTITVKEGDLVKVTPKVNDPDNDKIQVYYSYPLNASGHWQTKRGDAGNYSALVTVTDGELAAKEEVSIIVLSSNNPPEINSPDIITVAEGDIVRLNLSIKDKDGDNVTYTISGWIDSPEYRTNYDDAGQHTVTITATDGYEKVQKKILVNVVDNNRKPVLEVPENIVVKEGEKVVLDIVRYDDDNDPLTVIISGWMNSTEKVTTFSDAGNYTVFVIVSDGKDSVEKKINISVINVDRAPVINIEKSEYEVSENQTIEIPFKVYDPDGENFTVKAESLPRGATLMADKLVYSVPWDVASNENPEFKMRIKLIAKNILATEKEFNITVHNVNRKPVIYDYSGEKTYYVGQSVPLYIKAYDPDGDNISVKWSFGLFENYYTGFNHTRRFSSAGEKKVLVMVSDGVSRTQALWKVKIVDMPRIVVYEQKKVQYTIEEQPDAVLLVRN